MASKKSKSKSEANVPNLRNILPGIKRQKPLEKTRANNSPTYDLLLAVNQNFLAMGYSFDHVKNDSFNSKRKYASCLNNNYTKSPTPVLSVKFDSTTDISDDYEEKKEKLDIWIPVINPIEPVNFLESSCMSLKKQNEQTVKKEAQKEDIFLEKEATRETLKNELMLNNDSSQLFQQPLEQPDKKPSEESGKPHLDVTNVSEPSLFAQYLQDDYNKQASRTGNVADDSLSELKSNRYTDVFKIEKTNYLTSKYKGDLTSSDLYRSINFNRLKGKFDLLCNHLCLWLYLTRPKLCNLIR